MEGAVCIHHRTSASSYTRGTKVDREPKQRGGRERHSQPTDPILENSPLRDEVSRHKGDGLRGPVEGPGRTPAVIEHPEGLD